MHGSRSLTAVTDRIAAVQSVWRILIRADHIELSVLNAAISLEKCECEWEGGFSMGIKNLRARNSGVSKSGLCLNQD